MHSYTDNLNDFEFRLLFELSSTIGDWIHDEDKGSWKIRCKSEQGIEYIAHFTKPEMTYPNFLRIYFDVNPLDCDPWSNEDMMTKYDKLKKVRDSRVEKDKIDHTSKMDV